MPAAFADRVRLELRQHAPREQVRAERREVRLRDVRLADELGDLFGPEHADGLGTVEEAGNGIGRHRGCSRGERGRAGS